jgi:hypothetical protein
LTETESAAAAARATFALLLVACFAAFFVTQRLKHTPTVVASPELTPRFEPTPAGRHKEEHISFKLTHTEAATVTIEDSAGTRVATLVRARPLQRYKQFSLRWNGHEGEARSFLEITAPDGHRSVLPANDGPLAPPGAYRVRVYALAQHRAVPFPRTFTLLAR